MDKYLSQIKGYDNELDRIDKLVNFLENDLHSLHKTLKEEDFSILIDGIIKILEGFKDTQILESRAQKIFHDIKDYIKTPELNQLINCFQYSLLRQLNIVKTARNLFDNWKIQNDKCMLVEILKSHSMQEQEMLPNVGIRNISFIWDWYTPLEQEKFFVDLLNSTNFKIGIQLWNSTVLGIKKDRVDLLINLLKKGLGNIYKLENNLEFESWVKDNFNSLHKLDIKIFDEKVLEKVSLEDLERVLLTPEIQPYIINYKENASLINFIINSLEKEETEKEVIDLLEEIGEYQNILGKNSFDENSTNEEIKSLLKTLSGRSQNQTDEISLKRKFEMINSNFELQIKLWKVLPRKVREANIDILQGILKSKFKDYLPENLDRSFFININNSIDLAKNKRVDAKALANGQVVFIGEESNIDMLEQMNSPMLTQNIMNVFPFEKMIQILPHCDIETKIANYANNPQVLKLFEYVLNNSENWHIELNALLKNIESPRYEELMKDILNSNVEKLPIQQLINVFSNSKNHFRIETIEDAKNFESIRRQECIDILSGKEPEYMSWEFGNLSEDNKKRFALLQLSFGIDIDQAEELVKKYGTDIEDIILPNGAEGNQIKNIMETIKMILSPEIDIQKFYIQSKDKLLDLNMQNADYGFARLEAKNLNLYANLYNESLGLESEEIKYVNYEGSKIEVHEVTGDFNILLRLEQNVDSENGAKEFIERVFNNASLQVNGNCKTYIGQNFINYVQVESSDICLFGYMHCEKNSLHYASATNIISGKNNIAFSPGSAKSDTGNGIKLRRPDRIIDNARAGLNETTTQKWKYNSEKGKIDVDMPDFIIYVQETNNTDLENDKRWKVAQMVARRLEKTILIIPREKCAEMEYKKLEGMKHKLLESSQRTDGEDEKVLIERLIVEFNNNREGIMTSPELSKKYFTEEQNKEMMDCISEGLENLKQSDKGKYVEVLPKVCETLKKEIDKFYATSFDRTDIKLDIDKTREHLNVYEEFLMQHENVDLDLSAERKDELNFLSREIAQTDFYNMNEVHSIEHIEKVMLFSAILANNEGLSKDDTHLLLVASAFHDSGRNGKDGDEKHAEASAQQLEEYLINNPKNTFGIDKNNLGVLQTIIHYHEYKETTKGKTDLEEIHKLCKQYGVTTQNFEKVVKLCELLKDADALDRARFGVRGQNKWALNTEYLKSKTAKSISMIKFSESINLNLARETAIECYGMEDVKKYSDSKMATIQSDIRTKHLPYERIQTLFSNEIQSANAKKQMFQIPMESLESVVEKVPATAKKQAIDFLRRESIKSKRENDVEVVGKN